MQRSESVRRAILQLVENIKPFDALEAEHCSEVIDWINSEAEILRISAPADPPKHLTVYCVLLDIKAKSILLVDHRKAQRWLPTGGHIEVNEHPRVAAEREALEELGISATFVPRIGTDPFFLTSTETVGLDGGHIDISLWFVLEGNRNEQLRHNQDEFTKTRWFTFEEILSADIETLDPHMYRFVGKLQRKLG